MRLRFDTGYKGGGVYVGRYYIGFHLPLLDYYWSKCDSTGLWCLILGPLLVHN